MVEQCIDWMAEVWGQRALHDQARRGYKYTGATNALDGSEDHLIAREARVFWDNLGVSAKRDAVCHDVRVEVEGGRLRWGYDAVYSLVAPFPLRRALDQMVEFQDDEDVAPVEDEAAWSQDEDDDSHDSGDDGGDEEAVGEDDALHDGGDSDDAGAEGEVHALCDGGDGDAALSVAQADSVCEHSSRISALQQAAELLEGKQLSAVAQVLRNAMREEQRASVGTAATDAGVAQAMREQLGQEEQALAKQRQRVRRTMEAARVAKKARTEAKEMQGRLAAPRKKLREASEMQETQAAVKTFTPAMLGAGLPRGGGAAHRNRRRDVLNRLAARGAEFSAQGKNDWVWFRAVWDKKMCEEHGSAWGQVFAEQMQHLCEALVAGEASAVADFMASETQRALQDVLALRV